MRAVKLVGAAVIALTSTLLGFELVRREQVKLRVLGELCELIRCIMRHVKCFESPIDEITSDYRSEALDACGFGESMRNSTLAHCELELLPLDAAARREFEEFAHGVGLLYRDEELKRCEYYLEYFKGVLSREKECFERRRAGLRYIPLLCGAALVIILI